MATPSWYRPSNPVTILVAGVPTIIPADGDQLIAAGTVQVTPNSEIPASLLATPPAGVSTQILSTIANTTPGAQ